MSHIKVIGLGGIGSCLIDPLCRYLSSRKHSEVTLIDGDSYEWKNEDRQQFSEIGNKAIVTMNSCKSRFPKINFKAKDEYLTENNVVSIIRDNDIVMLCVDNDASRKAVSDRCEELDNVTLISGGNEYTDGNVMYYGRQNGRDITKPLTKLHQKIAKPKDVNPGDKKSSDGCEALSLDSPQLLFANLAIASSMLNVYYAHTLGKINFEQVFIDIVAQRMRPTPEREIVIED